MTRPERPAAAALPERVTVVEVGPRDGLQNLAKKVPTEVKVKLISLLQEAGLPRIEVTAFVHPRRVPQMADATEVLSALPSRERHSVLVPNLKGLERALEAGAGRIAVFTAASSTFSLRNTGMDVEASLAELRRVVRRAREESIPVRGYVSTAFVCPYEGDIPPRVVARVCRELLEMGVEEISLGDTLGAAAPTDVLALLDAVLELAPLHCWALHLHDTYGTALANVYAALTRGITIFDASVGGLGGCPFAPGAAGNLATEDLVYMLGRMGIETGVDLPRLLRASDYIARTLDLCLPARHPRRQA